MLFKKLTLLASATILGLSFLATPTVPFVEASTTNTKKTQVPQNNPVKGFMNSISTPILPDSTIQYRFSVTKTCDIRAQSTLISDRYEEVERKMSVVITDEEGKVVSTESIKNLPMSTSVTQAHLTKGNYMLEIKSLEGMPSRGVVNVEIYGSILDKGVAREHAVMLSKEGVLPQNVSTTLARPFTTFEQEDSMYIKEPNSKEYKLIPGSMKDHTYTFKGTKVGKYYLRIKTIYEDNRYSYRTIYIEVVKATTPTKLSLSTTKSTFKPKETIKLKASAKGNNLQYKYTYKPKGTKEETTIKDYSSSKTPLFKAPTKKGKYTLTLYVKQINGTKIVKEKKVITVK